MARWSLFVALALLAACGGGPRERIVLVTLDTCRADVPASMPALAAFAARGARFEQAYSATSITQPSHASLLTGLQPWQHGVTQNGEVLADSATTVAETLGAAGFATGAVVASFPLGRRFGFAQGFQVFRDDFQVRYAKQWEGQEVEGETFYSLGATVTDEALTVLDELDRPREFLWVHYFDAHDPYGDASQAENVLALGAVLQAAREQRAEVPALVARAKELYATDLGALDRALGRLLERLARDDGYVTHVIVVADHGESLGEQGSIGHGKRLVPEQVHVPLVILSPRVAPGTRTDTTGSVDVAATILSLAGLPRGAGHGRDLTLPPPADTSAFGMRRNFANPRPEQLLDGRELPVEGTRFFVARGGRLFTGDAQNVFEDDDAARPTPAAEAAELRATFQVLQWKLDGTKVETLDSAEVKNALRKLGYAE